MWLPIDIEVVQSLAIVVLATAVGVLLVRVRLRRPKILAYLYRLEAFKLVKFGLTEDHTRIGRHPENELRLKTKSISRFHAEIARNGNGTFSIRDVGSKNGIRVNLRQVNSSLLKEGDLVDVGGVRMKFTRHPTNFNMHSDTVVVEARPRAHTTLRRHSERQDLVMGVRLYSEERGWVNGRVKDLSAEGAFVSVDETLDERSVLHILFPVIKDHDRKWLRVSGEVVHSSNKGVGVRFTDPPSRTREVLRTLAPQAA